MKEWKGRTSGLKRVAEREDSVAEQRWDRRSNTAISWIRRWMRGTSSLSARRILTLIGWLPAGCSGVVMLASGLVAVALAAVADDAIWLVGLGFGFGSERCEGLGHAWIMLNRGEESMRTWKALSSLSLVYVDGMGWPTFQTKPFKLTNLS